MRKRKLRQFKSKQQRVAHFALFQKKLELQAKTQIDPKRPLNNLQFTGDKVNRGEMRYKVDILSLLSFKSEI